MTVIHIFALLHASKEATLIGTFLFLVVAHFFLKWTEREGYDGDIVTGETKSKIHIWGESWTF